MRDNTKWKYSQLRVESNNYTEELFGKKIEEVKVRSLSNRRVVGTAGAGGACVTPITFGRVNVPFFLFLGPPQTSLNGFTAPPTALPYFHFVKIINALYGLCPSKMAKNLLRIIWNHSKEMPVETFMGAKRWLIWLTPQCLQNCNVSVNSMIKRSKGMTKLSMRLNDYPTRSQTKKFKLALHSFCISKTFISNARLKLAKN